MSDLRFAFRQLIKAPGFTLVAVLTLALGIGIYGVVAYTVQQRTREIGIRIALGAGAGTVIRQVLREGLSSVLIGPGIGIAGAFGASRLIANQLYQLTTVDQSVIMAISCAVLLLAAVAACLVPARRATGVNPLEALRAE